MKTLMTALIILTTAGLVNAFEYGVADSPDDLTQIHYQIQDKVRDYNAYSEHPAYRGMLAYCVCALDRTKILYGWDVSSSNFPAGIMVARIKEAAGKACGGCTTQPSVVIIKDYGYKQTRRPY